MSGKGGILIVDFPFPSSFRSSYRFLPNFMKLLSLATDNAWAISDNLEEKDLVSGQRVFRIGIKIHLLRDIRIRWISSLVWLLRSIAIQLRIIQLLICNSRRTDIVIFFMMPAYVEMWPMLVARLLRLTVLKVPLGLTPARHVSAARMNDLFESAVLWLSHHYVPEYETSVPRLMEFGQLRYPEKMLPAAHFFVMDESFKATAQIHERERLVAYVGGFRRIKGVQNFATAMVDVLKRNDSGVSFVIAGDGDLRRHVELTVSALPPERVKMLAWTPRSEMPKLLNRIRLLVIPSYSEGAPNIAIEAMACGTPILSTEVGVIPALVRHGENGFILRDNSPASIAEGIVAVMNLDDESLQRIADKGAQTVSQKYALATAAARWKDNIDLVRHGRG